MTDTIQKNRLLNYYSLEKKSGFVLLGFAVSCMISTYLSKSFLPESLWTGMMFPLRIMGLLQVIIGLYIIISNSKKEKEWQAISTENKTSFLTSEQIRVGKIDNNLNKSTNVFMLLILLGGVFIILGFASQWGDFSVGTGIGLLIPSAVIYLLDLYRAFNVGTHLAFLNKSQS